MLSVASEATRGPGHGTRERPAGRASSKQGFDGSVRGSAQFVHHPSNSWGAKVDKQRFRTNLYKRNSPECLPLSIRQQETGGTFKLGSCD